MRTHPYSILLQSPDFVVADKAPGLLSIPDRHQPELPNLRDLLLRQYTSVWVVHRLDRDTSGCILFALNAGAHKQLGEQFENRAARKQYLGIVAGRPLQPSGTIDAPIAEHPSRNGTMRVHAKGKPSVTHYRLITSWGPYSLLSFDLETGRTHQIRVHCRHIGLPLACDPLYGDGKPVPLSAIKRNYKAGKFTEEERPLLSRLALHSYRLGFTDSAGNAVSAEAPLPRDLRALIQQLDKWNGHGVSTLETLSAS